MPITRAHSRACRGCRVIAPGRRFPRADVPAGIGGGVCAGPGKIGSQRIAPVRQSHPGRNRNGPHTTNGISAAEGLPGKPIPFTATSQKSRVCPSGSQAPEVHAASFPDRLLELIFLATEPPARGHSGAFRGAGSTHALTSICLPSRHSQHFHPQPFSRAASSGIAVNLPAPGDALRAPSPLLNMQTPGRRPDLSQPAARRATPTLGAQRLPPAAARRLVTSSPCCACSPCAWAGTRSWPRPGTLLVPLCRSPDAGEHGGGGGGGWG